MNDDRKEIVEELTQMNKDYIERYGDALWENHVNGTPIDMEGLGFWSFPVLYVTGKETREETAVTVAHRELYDTMVRALYKGFYDAGCGSRLQLERTDIHVVNSNYAIIESRGTRYKTDGKTPFNQWHACYWVRRIDGEWRQFGVCEADPPRPSIPQWTDWMRSFLGTD